MKKRLEKMEKRLVKRKRGSTKEETRLENKSFRKCIAFYHGICFIFRYEVGFFVLLAMENQRVNKLLGNVLANKFMDCVVQ